MGQRQDKTRRNNGYLDASLKSHSSHFISISIDIRPQLSGNRVRFILFFTASTLYFASLHLRRNRPPRRHRCSKVPEEMKTDLRTCTSQTSSIPS